MSLDAAYIDFSYRPGRPVLRAVSASFPRGLVTAVLGPNGAGKSTLLRVLAGLAVADAGRATLDGADVAAMPAAARAARVVHVPQTSGVAFAFTSLQVVRMGLYASGGGRRAQAMEALERVGLGERAGDVYATLSAGQRQRVTLARAIAQLHAGGPAGCALLADEPVSAMDPRHARDSLDLLRDAARQGAAVVVVLHDLAAALRHADHALLLDASGSVATLGPVADVVRPDRLEPVFGVPFSALESGGRRVAVVPS